MKTSLLTAMILAAAVAAPAVAQEEDEGDITQVFYLEVTPGHRDQFDAGWKAYWDCYRENGGTRTWAAWVPVSGKLGAVMFRSSGHNWADFDEENTAGMACGEVFGDLIRPHFGDAYSDFRETLRDVSRDTEDPVNLVMGIDFDVSNYGAAMEIISAWHEALEAADWGKYVWVRRVTSSRGWDLALVLLNENFADMAPGDKSFRDIQIAHHGEEKAAELGAKWRETVKRSRSRMFRRNETLSYSPEKD